MRVAAVDLGTHATRLLVADVEDGRIEEVDRDLVFTKLGEDVDRRRRLLPVPIARVRNCLSDYRRRIEALGAEVTDARHDAQSFGNYEVCFRASNVAFRITRDRRQYILHGPPRQELERAGLWRAFNHRDEFGETLLAWVRAFPA